jgi:two-component system response regulator FixJ
MAREATVFVVDDDPAMRKSLRWLLQSVGLTVEVFDSGEAFLARVDASACGCLILDLRMPGMGGLGLQEALTARGVDVPTIIVTGYAEVPSAVRAMKAGAIDFLEKPFSDEALLERVRHALAIERDRRQAREVRAGARARLAALTPRERQVLDELVQGHHNRAISAALGIAEKTVEVHRASVMRKLNAASLTDAIRLALAAEDEPRRT